MKLIPIKKIRIVFLTKDGDYRFVDDKNKHHNILYTYSIEYLVLKHAVEEWNISYVLLVGGLKSLLWSIASYRAI